VAHNALGRRPNNGVRPALYKLRHVECGQGLGCRADKRKQMGLRGDDLVSYNGSGELWGARASTEMGLYAKQ